MAFEDEVDLVFAGLGPQVLGARFGCLGQDPDGLGGQGLEQGAEQCAVSGGEAVAASAQQAGGVDQSGGQRGVDQVVLG